MSISVDLYPRRMRWCISILRLWIMRWSFVVIRRYLSAWLYIIPLLQLSGWKESLCSHVQIPVCMVYRVLSSLPSPLKYIVVSRKFTFTCEYTISDVSVLWKVLMCLQSVWSMSSHGARHQKYYQCTWSRVWACGCRVPVSRAFFQVAKKNVDIVGCQGGAHCGAMCL